MVACSQGQRCTCGRSDQHLYQPAGKNSCSRQTAQVLAAQLNQDVSPGSVYHAALDAKQAHRLTDDTARLKMCRVAAKPSAASSFPALGVL